MTLRTFGRDSIKIRGGQRALQMFNMYKYSLIIAILSTVDLFSGNYCFDAKLRISLFILSGKFVGFCFVIDEIPRTCTCMCVKYILFLKEERK